MTHERRLVFEYIGTAPRKLVPPRPTGEPIGSVVAKVVQEVITAPALKAVLRSRGARIPHPWAAGARKFALCDAAISVVMQGDLGGRGKR